MKKNILILGLALTLIGAAGGPAPDKDGEWDKGVPFTKDWKKAISQVRESGKMLFIYNGWERDKI